MYEVTDADEPTVTELSSDWPLDEVDGPSEVPADPGATVPLEVEKEEDADA
jgi:hypothetical protein